MNEIITLKDVAMSIAEQEELLEDICNDVLGYGPLEPLLARDDIADIMVNGSNTWTPRITPAQISDDVIPSVLVRAGDENGTQACSAWIFRS